MSRKDNLLESFGIGIQTKEKEIAINKKPIKNEQTIENNSYPKTIMFRGSSFDYAKLRAKELKKDGIGKGNVADFIEWLISTDREKHQKISEIAEKIFKLEEI